MRDLTFTDEMHTFMTWRKKKYVLIKLFGGQLERDVLMMGSDEFRLFVIMPHDDEVKQIDNTNQSCYFKTRLNFKTLSCVFDFFASIIKVLSDLKSSHGRPPRPLGGSAWLPPPRFASSRLTRRAFCLHWCLFYFPFCIL